MSQKNVYLDYAASTPMDPKVLKAMEPYFSKQFFNPSAVYSKAKDVRSVVEDSRRSVALNLGAKSSEIIFTAGGTEANNLALTGVMNAHPNGNMVISAIEHPSVYAPAKNFNARICPVDKEGLIKINKLKDLIDDDTNLVSIIYVSNEIGVIEPLKEVASIIQTIRSDRLSRGITRPIYFHTDACQAANYLDLHISKLGVDLMTLNGSKIYGPKQSGTLFVKSSVRLKPIIFGGGQERGLRSGTENVPGIIGFAAALDLAQDSKKSESDRLAHLQEYFITSLTNNFQNAKINGSRIKRVVNNVHVTFPNVDNERLLISLDEKGIMAAAGSACSASNELPSSVLKAIGLTNLEARNSIRFSFGRYLIKSDLEYTLDTLKTLLKLS
jgi:cysteine desulfurase